MHRIVRSSAILLTVYFLLYMYNVYFVMIHKLQMRQPTNISRLVRLAAGNNDIDTRIESGSLTSIRQDSVSFTREKCSLLHHLPPSTCILLYLDRDDIFSQVYTFYDCIISNVSLSLKVVTFTTVMTNHLRAYQSATTTFVMLTATAETNNTELNRQIANGFSKALRQSRSEFALVVKLDRFVAKADVMDKVKMTEADPHVYVDEVLLGSIKENVSCIMQCLHSRHALVNSSLIELNQRMFELCVRERSDCTAPSLMPSKRFSYLADPVNFGCYCSKYVAITDQEIKSSQLSSKNVKPHSLVTSADYDVVHLVYATDNKQFIGMQASIKSVLHTSKFKNKLHFHVFECRDCNYTQFDALANLSKLVMKCGAKIDIHYFHSDEVIPYVNIHHISRPDLRSPSNYIRYLLAAKLSKVDKCMWIDSDVLVLKDIVPFVNSVKINKLIAGFPQTIRQLIPKNSYKKLSKLGVKVAPRRSSWFIAGLIMMNLQLWRTSNATDDILHLCNLNREHKIITRYGSQAPLTLLYGDKNFQKLNPQLYAGNLWSKKYKSIKCTSQFIHWNGEDKPWNKESNFTEIWTKLQYKTGHIGEKFKC